MSDSSTMRSTSEVSRVCSLTAREGSESTESAAMGDRSRADDLFLADLAASPTANHDSTPTGSASVAGWLLAAKRCSNNDAHSYLKLKSLWLAKLFALSIFDCGHSPSAIAIAACREVRKRLQ